jgi:hypothetical protein
LGAFDDISLFLARSYSRIKKNLMDQGFTHEQRSFYLLDIMGDGFHARTAAQNLPNLFQPSFFRSILGSLAITLMPHWGYLLTPWLTLGLPGRPFLDGPIPADIAEELLNAGILNHPLAVPVPPNFAPLYLRADAQAAGMNPNNWRTRLFHAIVPGAG